MNQTNVLLLFGGVTPSGSGGGGVGPEPGESAYLLEDSSDFWLLEDGSGVWLME